MNQWDWLNMTVISWCNTIVRGVTETEHKITVFGMCQNMFSVKQGKQKHAEKWIAVSYFEICKLSTTGCVSAPLKLFWAVWVTGRTEPMESHTRPNDLDPTVQSEYMYHYTTNWEHT